MQSVRGTINNIGTFIQSLKTSLRIFIAGNKTDLSRLDLESNFAVLDKQLGMHFRDYYSFTVANSNGELLYDDFEERVGGICRKDIKRYAKTKGDVNTYIHPGPGKYHFDVMLDWKNNEKDMIFFISFKTHRIASLLRNAQAPGHRLVLLRSDLPTLVEISAFGNRSEYVDLINLSKHQQGKILYKGRIPGTRWVLVDIATDYLYSERGIFLLIRDGLIFLVILVIAGIMLRRIYNEEHQRRIAESALKESHSLLESRVQKRTSELNQSNQKLQVEVNNSKKLSRAIEQADDIIVITDPSGLIEYVNPAFERTTGYLFKEVAGQNFRKIKSGEHDEKFYKAMWGTLSAGSVFSDVLINRRKDGSTYYEEKTITPIRNNQMVMTHFVSTGKDITERIISEKRIQHLAYHDSLTELPNRTKFIERLTCGLEKIAENDQFLAVLFIDLDRFKMINDSLGHAMGDHLLIAISKRIGKLLTKGDTVSRFGGDEFALVIENVKNVDGIIDIARRILVAVAQPVAVGDYELYTTASIGITLVPFAEEKDTETLLKHADTAMYRAKDRGGNRFEIYSVEMGRAANRRLEIENHLHGALARNEFVLNYQPRVNLRTGEITGAEALLRWNSPKFGLVSPVEFIPILEETGKINEVGKWVLQQACTDFRCLPIPIRLAVNFSPRQFVDNNLEQDVFEILAETDFPADLLDVEITESLLVHDTTRVNKILNALHDSGAKISIDDFGTGYSSLSYLKDYPIDCLKIDRSFVSGLPDDMSNANLISAIISMAHGLNMTVVTEGIETEEQLAIISGKESEEAQGYYFSRPLPLLEFEQWLDSSNAVLRKKFSTG